MLKQRLTPAAEGGFFVRISRLKISFPRDDQGKVTGIQMPGPAGPMTGVKRTP